MPFGLDLGTTNSSIAWADADGTVHSLRVRRGPKQPYDSIEPSIVLDPLGDAVVGAEAETAARSRRGDTLVRSFKRRFDKQRLRQQIYRRVETATSEYDFVTESVRVEASGEWVPLYYDEYSREEVITAGAAMFRRLLTSTETDRSADATGRAQSLLARLADSAGDVESAERSAERIYLGVPVTFGSTARRRLLAALAASGCFGDGSDAYRRVLDRCRIVYEPLAMISTLSIFENQRVLIFDYGGGTLDVALLDVRFDAEGMQSVHELALGGLWKAGDALDARFRDALIESRPSLARRYRRQISTESPYDRWQADAAFANAKIQLSVSDDAYIPLFDESVTRRELEAAIAGELEEAIAAVASALDAGGARARDVGTVVLTGGSSLIPAVQDRMRELFPHLDELSFVAGRPGDIASEREALTGISRGLARFGFVERFETAAACDYSVNVPGVSQRAICLRRGEKDERNLDAAPAVAVPVDGRNRICVAMYSNLVRESYCGGVVDVAVPAGASAVDVRASASRERFAPAFGVYEQAEGRELARFDLDDLPAAELEAFVNGDCEWLPATKAPSARLLTRPLVVGDVIEWNGRGGRGKVIRIRDIITNQPVEAMTGFDPEPYVITVAKEKDGQLLLGHKFERTWKQGDVSLA